LYDKPIFADRTKASIYKNIKNDSNIDDSSGPNESQSKKLIEKIYKKGNMFEGTDITSRRGGRPIESTNSEDEYGLSTNKK